MYWSGATTDQKHGQMDAFFTLGKSSPVSPSTGETKSKMVTSKYNLISIYIIITQLYN
jgi:hypothetical protein